MEGFTMSTTSDVARHDTDAYTNDYYVAASSGHVQPLEFANTALFWADRNRSVIDTHGDDLDKAQAEAVCERVALAASACAAAVKQGRLELANAFANQANSEALVLSAFDYVNVSAP
jgi:hypothetical protein